MMEKKRAVLLDVSAIMYRAYFANMNFRTKTEPTGAVYGFSNTLLSIIKEFSPDYIGAAFDVKRSSLKRSEMYKEYKTQRESAPEDLIRQISRIEELLDAFCINRYKVNGYEADDVLGTLAKKIVTEDVEVFIVTSDKDLAQILDKNINIALLGKGDGGGLKIISSEEQVVEYLGVQSNKIPDLFGLIGDSSDGIPGVRKIGVKKAIPMLEKYGNLEGIYENIDKLTEIPGIGKSLVTNMIEDKELAFLSRKLATICQNIELDVKLDELTYCIDKEKLYSLFKTLEFKALIKKLELDTVIKEDSLESIKPKNRIKVDARELLIIENNEKLEILKNEIQKEAIISLYNAELGIMISTERKDYYVPYRNSSESKIGENISLFAEFTERITSKIKEIDLKLLEDILNNYKGDIITYNLKRVIKSGLDIKNCKMDMMIAYHLISSQTKESIELPIEKTTNIELVSYVDTFGKEKPENLDIVQYAKFLGIRNAGLIEAYEPIKNELEEKNLKKILNDIEMPLIRPLAKMEEAGIKIDAEYFKVYDKELTETLEDLQKKIYTEAETTFNINSPKQLAEILFFKLGYQPVKKTKTGLSTDEEVLETLRKHGSKIAEYILEFRKLSKLKNTYVDAIPKLRDSNNRVHTTFNQIGTVTGRLSSSDPNLQNIPAKTNEGMKIRRGFIAEEGNLLIGIDYSQIELRVLAELSEDEELRRAYANNEDLHSLTAKKIFELSNDSEVTKEQRVIAKTINFSIIYGKTAFGLSKELGITPKEAAEYIDRYFSQYPKVKDFEKKIIEFTEKHGYTETYFGRRRIIDDINSKNKNIKSQAERMAVNSVIQGTAAEILKKVMIEIYKYIESKEGIKLLLQVHDELIFEVKREFVEKYREDIENIMRNTVKFDNVKLDINTNIGKNWAETK